MKMSLPSLPLQYFDNIGLSDSQKQDRLKLCSRHKAKFTTAGTPPHFWSVGFPDTQECEERGGSVTIPLTSFYVFSL